MIGSSGAVASFACRTNMALMFIALAVAANAQSVPQSASVIGQVKDSSGGILPGVTVTVTSPALQVPQVTSVTDSQGEYRVTPLPLGMYRIEYTLSGFRTLRIENVRLTGGSVARLDQVMELGALEQAITVSGASPIVDTTSAATRTTLMSESMTLLPSSQSGLSAMLSFVPGARANIDVGGTDVGVTTVFQYNGQFGQAWQLLEGVIAGRQNNAGSSTKYDFTIVEEARVQPAGNSAEMPKRGIFVDVVVKSGSNQFHGSSQWVGSHPSLQSSNVDDALRAQGISNPARLSRKVDRNAQIGGRIVRDRLWFFSSVRELVGDQEVIRLYKPDGSPEVNYNSQRFIANKLSFQVNPENRLIGFMHYTFEDGDVATEFTPKTSGSLNLQRIRLGKLEWQSVPRSWFIVSLQGGVLRGKNRFDTVGRSEGVPASRDIATLMNAGQGDNTGTLTWLYHHRGVATIYAPQLFLGNHEFKMGFDTTPDTSHAFLPDRGAAGNYRLLFNNGAPDQIEIYNNPIDAVTKASYFSIYGQDSWTIRRRLTLNLGVRAAHDNATIPEQCQAAGQFEAAFPAQCSSKIQMNIWNTVAPRLHAVYDLSGDGRSILKGGWGRFPKKREAVGYEVASVNPNNAKTYFYRWRDLNGNRNYDPGEVNLNPEGPDFLRGGVGSTTAGGAYTGGTLNPNELQPLEDEYTLAFERELVKNLGVRLSGVHARNYHVNRLVNRLLPYDLFNIPISNKDPGPDGVLGSADDTGTTITYYEFPAQFAGSRFQETLLVNDDPINNTRYSTVEFALTKRLASNWQLAASHSATKVNVPFGDGAVNALAWNPNAEFYAARRNWEWITKVNGSYRFPKGIVGSFNYDARSGPKLAREVLFRGGRTIPSIAMRVEPVGSIALPTLRLLDLRAAKQFEFGRGTRLEVYLDLFNILNVNTTLNVTVRSGPNFMIPTQIVNPRILGVGGRFTF